MKKINTAIVIATLAISVLIICNEYPVEQTAGYVPQNEETWIGTFKRPDNSSATDLHYAVLVWTAQDLYHTQQSTIF